MKENSCNTYGLGKKPGSVWVFILAFFMVLSVASPSFAASDGSWRYDSGWWYRHPGGWYTTNNFETINGHTYYFGGSGYITVGWRKISGHWYYFDNNGYMLKNTSVGGWKLDDQGRYVSSSASNDSTQVSGKGQWRKYSGSWWYRHADGTYTANGFETIDGHTYYFNGSGYMVVGWRKISGYWYYFNGYGYMLKNTTVSGWKLDGQGHYVDQTPQPKDEWRTYNGKRWYRHANGTYTTNGFETIGGHTYYFDGSGYMVVGWRKASGYWYYFNNDGHMLKNTTVSGWKLDGQGRYVEESNHQDTDNQVNTGRNGWYGANGRWRYYVNGKYLTNQRRQDQYGVHYFGSDGYMVCNRTIEGYHYDSYGNGTYVGDSADTKPSTPSSVKGGIIYDQYGYSTGVPYPSFSNSKSDRIRKTIVDAAIAAQGISYGSYKQGICLDCSGFTLYAYGVGGIQIDPWAAGQGRGGKKVSLSQAKPGDILHYYANGGNHVGIYLGEKNGNRYWVHQNSGIGYVSCQLMDGYRDSSAANVRNYID